jgi:hypothetical protein
MHAFLDKITIVRNIYICQTIILEISILIPSVVSENTHGQKSTEGEGEAEEEEEEEKEETE